MRPSPSAMSDRSQPSDGALIAIKARAVEIARALGAASVRVADAAPDESTARRLAESFDRGDLSSWPYDDAYARAAADPASILPGARRVICIAFPYASPPPKRTHLRGRVSNYAWSRDYHARVRAALREVASEIDRLAGEGVTAVACDTRPIAERAFAARAGIGWVGKHTNLIAPHAGSFVFLGEIVTTLALPPDAPSKKSCGSCTRCVDVCPTRALRGDYTIDASRCIADLTQRTDAIPAALRPLVGDWVWGCDLCQEICPPTRNAGATGDPANAPLDEETAAPTLIALLHLRSGTFKRRFAATAMAWRGGAVLRRNAAVALGNALDRSTVPALAAALHEDPHPMVRGHVAWALGRIGSPQALAALRERGASEPDAGVRGEIASALEPFAAPGR